MSISSSQSAAYAVSTRPFYPLNTVRCDGPAFFRTQVARDLACLLDVDDDVVSWSCGTMTLSRDGQIHVPDFVVIREDVTFLAHCKDDDGPPRWARAEALRGGLHYEVIEKASLPPIRLKNAKDLLRYAKYEAALSDRVRLLAALDENSSLTVAEALTVFQETKTVAGLASMVLRRFITVDLDERLIGPETIVRRKRD